MMNSVSGYQKKKYPWRLGATSFVVPADLITNVRLLAGLVDDVQLLFFESSAKAQLPHHVDTKALQVVAGESGLTYTAHLPGDIRLGANAAAERQAGIDEIVRLVEKLHPLAVASFDLHLVREPELSGEEWRNNLHGSLAALAEGLGDEKERICIENIDYSFAEIESLVYEHGFSVCLDIGHLLRYGHQWRAGIDSYSPVAKHLHYHGVINGKDHEAVVAKQGDVTDFLGEVLIKNGFTGVVTLEMYELAKLEMSLAELAKAWDYFSEE